jgi:hypothetical protein
VRYEVVVWVLGVPGGRKERNSDRWRYQNCIVVRACFGIGNQRIHGVGLTIIDWNLPGKVYYKQTDFIKRAIGYLKFYTSNLLVLDISG